MRRALIGPPVLLAALWAAPGVALADPTYPPVPPSGSPAPQTEFSGAPTAPVQGSTGAPGEGLPLTGTEVALLALAGGASLAAGGALVVGARRRAAVDRTR